MASATTSSPQAELAPAGKPFVPTSLWVVTGLVLAAFVPLLWSHMGELWQRPHYQFFPIVFLGAAFLAWTRLAEVESFEPGAIGVSTGLFAGSWSLLAAAELLNIPLVAAVGWVFLVLALIYTFGGAPLVRKLFLPWVFLWLIIRLPLGLDTMLVLTLQNLTTHWSSSLLDQFGVFHALEGNVVEIGGRHFFVEEACTGINSLFSILACTLFYVFYTRPSVVRSICLIIAGLSWVLLANVIRIFLIAYLAKRWDIDLAEGYRHDALGFFLFAMALLMIWSTDRLFMFVVTSRKTKASAPAASPMAPRTSGAAWLQRLPNLEKSCLNHYGIGAAFGFLLAVHIVFYSLPAIKAGSVDPALLTTDTLPAELDGWKHATFKEERRNPGSAFGEYSKIWNYQADGNRATFSVDYPFPVWHDLLICYRNQGWEVDKMDDFTSREAGVPACYCERQLRKTGMRAAYLFFCEFDQTGRAVKVSRPGVATAVSHPESILYRSQVALNRIPESSVELPQVGQLLQFQLLVESHFPLGAEDLQKAREHFFKGYQIVRKQLCDKAETAP